MTTTTTTTTIIIIITAAATTTTTLCTCPGAHPERLQDGEQVQRVPLRRRQLELLRGVHPGDPGPELPRGEEVTGHRVAQPVRVQHHQVTQLALQVDHLAKK